MSDPRDKVHDIDIPGRTRWALRIRGIDDAGNHRVLALDWDGVWHPLDPVTGADARIGVLIHFCDLRPGEVAFSERSGDHWPYAARIGEKFTWTRQPRTPTQPARRLGRRGRSCPHLRGRCQ